MVYLFLAENHETVEALTVVDILRRANINITTVSITDELNIKSSLDIIVQADTTFNKINNFDNARALVLPGGGGVEKMLVFQPLLDLVNSHYKKGTLVSAICAAPKVLYKAGITVNSTIYPTMSGDIPKYVKSNVVVDGNVITGEALGSSIDFALEIVKYLKDETLGKATAEKAGYYNWESFKV